MAILYYDVYRVVDTYTNLVSLLQNGMIGIDTTNNGLVFKYGGTCYKVPSESAGYLKINGTNSPTSNIDWGDYDLNNVGQILLNGNNVVGVNTSNGSDTSFVSMCGASAAGVTRSGRVDVYGNEHSQTGSVRIVAGNVPGGEVSISTQNTVRVTIGYDGDVVIAGDNVIRRNTSDGSDDGYLKLCGGGAGTDARGGKVVVYGNEHPTLPGSVYIDAGNVVGGEVKFYTGATLRVAIGYDGDVGIGTSSPDVLLHARQGSSGATLSSSPATLALENSSNVSMVLASPNNTQQQITFLDSDGDEAAFGYNHSTEIMFCDYVDKINFGKNSRYGGTHTNIDGDGNASFNGEYIKLPVKTNAGDPTSPADGWLYVNTNDNKISVYADGAWRDLATWT